MCRATTAAASLALLMIIGNLAHAQNLVPNPGFETYTSCPTNTEQLTLASPWFNPNSNQTEIFNACHTANIVGVPGNDFGHQSAHSGTGYAGINVFTGSSNFREYLSVRLSNPMVSGNTYCVELSVSLADSSRFAIENIGIYFSANDISTSGFVVLPHTPQMEHSGSILQDQNGWVKISGTFIAANAYEFMTIGNFRDDGNTNNSVANATANLFKAYYYVDDVHVFPSPTIDLPEDTTACSGSNLSLDAGNAGATFLWSTGATTQVINPSTSGVYWVDVTTASCTIRDSTLVNIIPPVEVDLGRDTTICVDNLLTLSAGNPGASYSWSTGETTQTITPTISGLYAVEVIDAHDCMGSDEIDLEISTDLTVAIAGKSSICSPGSGPVETTLQAPGFSTLPGVSYQWSHRSGGIWSAMGANSETLTVSDTGKYAVFVNFSSCSGTDTLRVEMIDPPSVDLGEDVTICSAEPLVLTLNSAYDSIRWTNGSQGTSLTVNKPGTYGVTACLSACCAEDEIAVDFFPEMELSLKADLDYICPGTPVRLIGEIDAEEAGGISYRWSNGDTTATTLVDTAGLYSLTVFQGECSIFDTITIAPDCTLKIFMPTAFTPGNKDGRNDIFKPVGHGITSFRFRVFDRWGQLIFEGAENEGWDGKSFNGREVPTGIYAYRVYYKGLYHNVEQPEAVKAGTVFVVR